MEQRVRSKAIKILGAMQPFAIRDDGPPGLANVVGVYDGPGDGGPVWVTTDGVAIQDAGGWELLRFDRMSTINAPKSKAKVDPASGEVQVTLSDGRVFIVQIRGGRGRFCDSFEFSRFLNRAAAMVRSE